MGSFGAELSVNLLQVETTGAGNDDEGQGQQAQVKRKQGATAHQVTPETKTEHSSMTVPLSFTRESLSQVNSYISKGAFCNCAGVQSET